MSESGELPAHIKALLAPGAIDPGGDAPLLVQTHISWVILAGGRACKLKKPRDFGFLDFTTLPRRRAACEAEVALNRRVAHGVYLGVEPVTRDGSGFRLGGDGEVVDYAVLMRRLPAERMLDYLVEHGDVSADLIDGLARHLADFYRDAATGPQIDRYTLPAAILENCQENFAQTLPYVGRTISPATYARIARSMYADLARLRPLFAERIAQGRARDCHGDLRLSAVCFDDGIQVYDCIEFNARFRYGDVAADIAFLAMDLDAHGRPDLADEFIAAYVAASGDTTLPAVLPFYACYRAYVRGKVQSFQLDEAEVPRAQQRAVERLARQRFKLAGRYARPPRPRLALVFGADAATRGNLAAALAGRLGAVLVDGRTDPDLEHAAGRLHARIPVVVSASSADKAVLHLDSAAQLTGMRPLRVSIESSAALPGQIVIHRDQPLRAMLRTLHGRVDLWPAGAGIEPTLPALLGSPE